MPRKAGRLREEIDIVFCVYIWPKAYFHRSLGHRPRNGVVVHHPVSWLKAMFTLRVTLEMNMAVGQNLGFATIRPGALPCRLYVSVTVRFQSRSHTEAETEEAGTPLLSRRDFMIIAQRFIAGLGGTRNPISPVGTAE